MPWLVLKVGSNQRSNRLGNRLVGECTNPERRLRCNYRLRQHQRATELGIKLGRYAAKYAAKARPVALSATDDDDLEWRVIAAAVTANRHRLRLRWRSRARSPRIEFLHYSRWATASTTAKQHQHHYQGNDEQAEQEERVHRGDSAISGSTTIPRPDQMHRNRAATRPSRKSCYDRAPEAASCASEAGGVHGYTVATPPGSGYTVATQSRTAKRQPREIGVSA